MDPQINFPWASRLWVGTRKEPILGYFPKNDGKKNSGTNGLICCLCPTWKILQNNPRWNSNKFHFYKWKDFFITKSYIFHSYPIKNKKIYIYKLVFVNKIIYTYKYNHLHIVAEVYVHLHNSAMIIRWLKFRILKKIISVQFIHWLI